MTTNDIKAEIVRLLDECSYRKLELILDVARVLLK